MSGRSPNTDSKKKLYSLNPDRTPKKVETHKTKRKKRIILASPVSIERDVRELLSKKLTSSYAGLWLLIPEYLRLGSWDLLKVWTGGDDTALSPRLALQIINEAALCVSGVRPIRSVAHQGFELLNGLPFLATDKEVHTLLDEHTIEEAKRLQIALAILRLTRGDYSQSGLLAFDPHRILSYSRRIMPMKKRSRGSRSEKILQSFFSMDAPSGQPIVFTIGFSSSTTSSASMELLEMLKTILPYNAIAMADSEHATASPR